MCPHGVDLWAFYSDEGDQAQFSVRFGTDAVVPSRQRHEAQNLLLALDGELLTGDLTLGPDGSIALHAALPIPYDFIQPGIYRKLIRQLVFDIARHALAIDKMLVASEPGSGVFGQILGSVVTTMEADIDTFAGGHRRHHRRSGPRPLGYHRHLPDWLHNSLGHRAAPARSRA